MTPSPSSTQLARQLVQDLIGIGVREAVLSPGSRSGPLALALAAADAAGALRAHVRIDERSAGFLALGLSKTSHRWVPVVTTSGTAVANLHPALLEAKHAGVRLLALSADRPARLRGTGANQTTNQVEFFPGIPYGDAGIIGFLGGLPTGPAQFNVELDEPLLEPIDWVFEPSSEHEKPARDRPAGTPVPVDGGTVVVAGDDSGPRARIFAQDAGLPLLAEPSSGARNGYNPIVAYRLLLAHAPVARRITRVVAFGHPTLSRPITTLLGRTDIDVLVAADDLSGFPHPPGHALAVGRHPSPDGSAEPEWLDSWLESDRLATAAIDGVLDGTTPYDVARTVSAAVPPEGLLFVGSSNPIRDLDLVSRPYTVGERRLVIANRGLSGIDGTVSSAIGAALARSSSRSLAYMGDLTFLHDVNGLLIGPGEPRPDLTVVVASDDGGSIFSTLEQGGPEYAASFERVYATPTGASIAGVCAAYGVPHRLATPIELAAALDEPTKGIRVIEVPLARDNRRDVTARLSEAVRTALTR
ncbi:MAG: thiamine pyrophosphate-binding protein [Actinomycetota bacterium]|nr:thiamine pyrophosphate-binding protein [Actinomycetota bacterium]